MLSRRQLLKLIILAAGAKIAGAPRLAAASESTGDVLELTEDVALDMADRFAKAYDPGLGVCATSATPFYDSPGQYAGMIVDFSYRGASHGYVVIEPDADGCIGEFSFSERFSVRTLGLDGLSEGGTAYSLSSEGPLERVAPYTFRFGDSLGDGGSPGTRSTPTEWRYCVIPISEFSQNYRDFESGWSHERIFYLSQDDVIAATGRYACVVSAAYEVAAFYGAGQRSIVASDYLELWERTRTTVYKTESGILYGETDPYVGASGCAEYCIDRGRTVGQTTDMASPSFSRFSSCVNSSNCGLFHAAINKLNEDGSNGGRSGHTMMFQGYMLARRLEGGPTVNFLVVANGWHNGFRLVNYGLSSFTERGGSFFWGTPV